MSWIIIKRLYAMLMITSLLLLFGCNSVVETPNEQIVSEYVENISDAEVVSEEDIIESESEEIQEESTVSENDVIENMEGSESEEVEDVEVIKEKALVAYQEYIDSNEMLEYATPTGEPDRRYLTKYLIWDINGDEIPELHINNSREYFIYEYSIKEDKAVCWKVLYPYNYPKEDGTMFGRGIGRGANDYWEDFWFYKFDEDGNEIDIVSFSMRDSNNDSVFDELDEYDLNGELCTYSEWREVAQDYLNLEGVDSIILSDLEYLDLVEWTVYCEAK